MTKKKKKRISINWFGVNKLGYTKRFVRSWQYRLCYNTAIINTVEEEGRKPEITRVAFSNWEKNGEKSAGFSLFGHIIIALSCQLVTFMLSRDEDYEDKEHYGNIWRDDNSGNSFFFFGFCSRNSWSVVSYSAKVFPSPIEHIETSSKKAPQTSINKFCFVFFKFFHFHQTFECDISKCT